MEVRKQKKITEVPFQEPTVTAKEPRQKKKNAVRTVHREDGKILVWEAGNLF